MIVFCEDCGKKNDLDSLVLNHEKKMYRCSFCNYLNPYPAGFSREIIRKKAVLFFRQISCFPEIIGSFLFHRTAGVLESSMPAMLKQTDLNHLGNLLSNNYLECRSHYTDVNEMAVVMSGKNMIVNMLGPDLFVVVAGRTFPLTQAVLIRLADWVKKNAD